MAELNHPRWVSSRTPSRWSATIVVVNKADRVHAVGPVLRELTVLSQGATVVPAVYGGIDPVMVFDVAHRADPAALDIAAVMGEAPVHRHATAVTVEQHGPTSAAALVRLVDVVPDGVRRVGGHRRRAGRTRDAVLRRPRRRRGAPRGPAAHRDRAARPRSDQVRPRRGPGRRRAARCAGGRGRGSRRRTPPTPATGPTESVSSGVVDRRVQPDLVPPPAAWRPGAAR